ncbi:MAG: 16S rRNA (adenine(1518)-N(6)/adenine(1519)-N(6))-dimethyltransferase RsmA [Erysipelotrichaceae bacterium]
MIRRIATPSRTKEILEKHQLFAKKNYGQNFLIEPGIVEKIATHAIVSDHCVAFEIGPGIGALTQELAEHAQKVIAYEIDDRLIPVLADTLAPYDNVEVRHGDFLERDLQADVAAFTQQGYDVVIAANLPYYITTPILFKIFESNARIARITVMMQKEVADRFSAQVNTKDYNALSVITQYRCDVKTVMKIPKNVFNPKPNVDSAVVQFTFKETPNDINEDHFFEIVKACFKQRRKTILNNYAEYVTDKETAKQQLEAANIAPAARAESLTLEDFLRLYKVNQHANLSQREN